MVNQKARKKRYKRNLKNRKIALKNCECEFEFNIKQPPKMKTLLREYYRCNKDRNCEDGNGSYYGDDSDDSYVPLIFSVENNDKVTIHPVVPSNLSLKKKWFGFFLDIYRKKYETTKTTKTTKTDTTKKNKTEIYKLQTEINKKKIKMTENNQKIFLLQNEKGKDEKSWERKVISEETKLEVRRLQNDSDLINEEIKKLKECIMNST